MISADCFAVTIICQLSNGIAIPILLSARHGAVSSDNCVRLNPPRVRSHQASQSRPEDSGEAARLFRDDGARDSDMMPPGSAATLADGFVALGLCRRQSSKCFE
jgi:hypothetical protein